MFHFWRISILAACLALAAGPALAEDPAPGGLVAEAAPSAAPENDVLAEGPGGTFTRDAAHAYVEALEFVLAEVGQPATFDAYQRAQIHEALAAGFADLPPEAQTDLANARPLWTRYHSEWATLPFESKQEFAYHVLAIAYGEQAAAQALGLNAGGGTAQPGAGGGAAPSVDDMIGNVPGTTDCWASAGCSGYDPGSGTYTYESYE